MQELVEYGQSLLVIEVLKLEAPILHQILNHGPSLEMTLPYLWEQTARHVSGETRLL